MLLKIDYNDWLKQVAHKICRISCFCRKHKLTLIREVGMRRIERELDVTRFIRNQLKIQAVINALTTKKERVYLKHNYRFMLGDENEVSDTSESVSEGYQTDFEISEFKVGYNLFNDLRKKPSNKKVKQVIKDAADLDISNDQLILN